MITFFYKQDEDAGATEWMDVKTATQTIALHIYSQAPLRPTAAHYLQDKQLPTDSAYPEFMKELSNAVVEYGKGGLIAESTTDGRTFSLRISAISKNEPHSPEEGLLLRPGYPAKFVGLGNRLKLSPGQHLIVPVDKDAQEKLKELAALLKWFPPDTEDLILNMIWRPGLERRLHEVEEKVGVKSAYGSLSKKLEESSFLSRFSRWREIVSLMSLVLIFGLVLFSFASNRTIDGIQRDITRLLPPPPPGHPPPEPVPPEPVTPEPVTPEPVTPEPVTPEPVQSSLIEISDVERGRLDEAFRALNEKLSSRPAANIVGVLYDSHFKEKPVSKLVDLENNESYSWGMVKLLALSKDLRLPGVVISNQTVDVNIKNVMSNLERRSDAKKLLEAMSPNRNETHLLALVTCMAFKENRDLDQAGLPAVRDDSVPGRVGLSMKCSDVKAALVLEGLQSLMKN